MKIPITGKVMTNCREECGRKKSSILQHESRYEWSLEVDIENSLFAASKSKVAGQQLYWN